MPRECLGEYQPEGQCLNCVLAFLCIEVALRLDGYFDELAERDKEEQWAVEDMLTLVHGAEDGQLWLT